MVDMKRSRCDVFLRRYEERNAEFRQEWGRPTRLEMVLPRYKEQKKRPNLFRFGLQSSGGCLLTAVATLNRVFDMALE
jgi:hypothetical protein